MHKRETTKTGHGREWKGREGWVRENGRALHTPKLVKKRAVQLEVASAEEEKRWLQEKENTKQSSAIHERKKPGRS